MRLPYLMLGMSLPLLVASCGPNVQEIPDPTSSSSSSGGSGGGNVGGMGGSGGAPPVAQPECTQDSDCMLINDCCTCAGAPKDKPFPQCPITECFASTCEANGLPAVAPLCVAGHCVVNADCNQAHVQCNTPPFACSPGKTIHVANGCWGGCVDPAECKEVGSCAQCNIDHACVENVDFSSSLHCVELPDGCSGKASCECMGPSTCVDPYGLCIEQAPTELRCECISC